MTNFSSSINKASLATIASEGNNLVDLGQPNDVDLPDLPLKMADEPEYREVMALLNAQLEKSWELTFKDE